MEWYFRNDQPIYTQLTQQITLAILSGSIPSGGRLPTVRELAAEAGVNPNTVQRALAELEGTGLLHTQRTAGRFVTEGVTLVHGAAGLQPAAGESAAGHMGGGITWQFWNAGS